MKLALTTQNNQFNIDIQLDNFISHTTDNHTITQVANRISQQAAQHFTLLRDVAKQKEDERVAYETLQSQQKSKKNRRFSNFTQPLDTQPKTFKQATQSVSLSSLQKLFEQDGLAMNSGLPEVVRFRNSPYAYTVKSNEWSSPFGTSGTSVEELLLDIANHIFKMSPSDTKSFVLKYSR